MRSLRLSLTLLAGTLLFITPAFLSPVAGTAQEPTTTTSTTEPPPVLPHLEEFESQDWHDDWVDWRLADDRNTSITRAYRGNGLRVNIPPGERRGTGPLWKMPDGVDEAWFRYRIRLDDFEPIYSSVEDTVLAENGPLRLVFACLGAAVLIVSSDLPELLELSDVIHVVRDGKVVGTLPAEVADERSVMTLAAGGTGLIGA